MTSLQSYGQSIPKRLAAAVPPVKDLLILAALVAFASWLSFVGTAGNGDISTLWLANGLILGAMLTYPDRWWPALCATAALGNFIGGLVAGLPFGLTLGFVACNLVEITAGIMLLYRPGDPVQHFTERASAARICSSVLLAPLASCVLAAIVQNLLLEAPFWEVCRQWYIAHVLGLEIMTPLALALRHKELQSVFSIERRVQSTVCLALLACISVAVFAQTAYSFLFMIFPPLVLVVFVLGFVGMSFGMFMVAMIALGFTLAGHGPFMLMTETSTAGRILMAQGFLLTAITMILPIAVALAERARLEQRLIGAQDQLRLLSFTDQLTGLSNRRLFDEFSIREWKRACRERTSISAIMIDVDMFKAYNDRYGHQAGDKCLAAVASAIGTVATRPGDLTARYGGEEFVVLLAGTPPPGCELLAERIRKSVEALQLPHAASPFGRVTVSLGTATLVGDHESSFSALIEQADKALYEAKHLGRNRVINNSGLTFVPLALKQQKRQMAR
jgi:diguanylate cyclase (GGDEF)-like protein